jgi:uncharacterized protein
MPSATTSVSIPTPARYMGRLCNHFAHRVPVHREPDRARVEFPDAPCSMQVRDDRLEMRIEAADSTTLERLQEVVTRHLKQVAPTESFEVSWTVA